MKSKLAVLLIAVVCSSGCAAVLVGGLIAHSSSTKGQKKDFVDAYHTNNTEREKAGLAPLDFCSEAFRFDPGWAASLPECKGRIKRYMAGDSTALFQPQMAPVAQNKATAQPAVSASRAGADTAVATDSTQTR